jgi:hypothetical protein
MTNPEQGSFSVTHLNNIAVFRLTFHMSNGATKNPRVKPEHRHFFTRL